MGLPDYNKKLTFKDFFVLLLLVFLSESLLLLAFLLEKEIRIQIWKFSFIFDLIFFLLLLINKIIKSNVIYTIATIFNPSFRAVINLALIILIRYIGFNYSWFIPIVIVYFSMYILIFLPEDKLESIKTFFLDSKVISIGLFLLFLFSSIGNNRYVVRYKVPGSFSELSGAVRLGIGLLIINYYFMILALTTIKISYKQFNDEKLLKKGFVEEL